MIKYINVHHFTGLFYGTCQFRVFFGSGKVTELNLHPDLKKKIEEEDLPSGFSMGVDKNGYFIHTHRARSKSHLKPGKITAKEIKFID